MPKAFRFGSLCTSLLTLAFAGCTASQMGGPVSNLTGNWSFTTQSASSASQLTLNAGLVSQVNGQVTAVAHLNGASCFGASTPIAMAGTLNGSGQLKLVSQPFNGTVLTIKAEVQQGTSTLTKTSLTFTGGNCGSLGAQAATTTQYAQINGTYAGTFVDAGGNSGAVTSVLTQTTQPDANGTFHLSGSSTFANNPCFSQPILTDSLVTGSNMSTTYAQGTATITAVGTFNADATQLTVTNWHVSGGMCDGDSGTGVLTKQ